MSTTKAKLLLLHLLGLLQCLKVDPPHCVIIVMTSRNKSIIPLMHSRQGLNFSKTGRKCGIFGVCNDGRNQQVIYLIDEAENPGKGADCVISMVHHYLGKYGQNEKAVYLHADNCTVQNKNNVTIQYLMWCVMTSKNESIELSFMLAGHTKFSPNRLWSFQEVILTF